jgi:nitroimidazol reductase NimA-like FMN-containing flavoprotein (pyridoxamine 5'-phosphate oxidase superfamily)
MRFDSRFSDPAAGPTPWEDVVAALERAELYWLSTVRRDGRPHVTPLVGVWHDGAMHFSTGWRSRRRATSRATPRSR